LVLAVVAFEALFPPTVTQAQAPRNADPSAPHRPIQEEHDMHATIRRYQGVDPTRTTEVADRVKATLVPQLCELPGFAGYYLIEAEDGVLSSLGLFETAEQAEASTTVVARWITDEQLETALPHGPEITTGHVVAHSDGDADAYDRRGARVQSSD
jgi:hypothetical protein